MVISSEELAGYNHLTSSGMFITTDIVSRNDYGRSRLPAEVCGSPGSARLVPGKRVLDDGEAEARAAGLARAAAIDA
jgi:hypothetical protein